MSEPLSSSERSTPARASVSLNAGQITWLLNVITEYRRASAQIIPGGTTCEARLRAALNELMEARDV